MRWAVFPLSRRPRTSCEPRHGSRPKRSLSPPIEIRIFQLDGTPNEGIDMIPLFRR